MIIVLNWLILVMTFGLVQVADVDYVDNDTALSELNGYSLNEVFEDNNFASWSKLGYAGNVIKSIVDDVLIVENLQTNRYPYLELNNNNGFDIGDLVYYRVEAKVLTSGERARLNLVLQDPDFNLFTSYGIMTDFESLTYTEIIDEVATYDVRLRGVNYNPVLSHWREFYVINLSSLGINLDNDQMNDYYEHYKNNIVYDYDYTLNTLDMTHVTIIVGSFFLWTWLYKFLKGVVL